MRLRLFVPLLVLTGVFVMGCVESESSPSLSSAGAGGPKLLSAPSVEPADALNTVAAPVVSPPASSTSESSGEFVTTTEEPPATASGEAATPAPAATAASSAQDEAIARAPADAWPVFRGNSAGTGLSSTTLPDKITRLWEYQPEKPTGFAATPVIADGLVVAADLDGTIHALSAASGDVAWTRTFDTNFGAPLGVNDGIVVLGDMYGMVRAVDLKTGENLWGLSDA